MPLPIFTVDAFTDRAFAGNPAAVCLLDAPREDAFLKSVAAEMNLSETAFLLREGDAFRLRWFTPAVEVELCGHATLESAHVLWEQGLLPPSEPARFLSRSGPLGAARRGSLIELDFPAKPAAPAEPPPGLVSALGVAPREVHRKAALDALEEVKGEITSGKWDIIILDEIFVACQLGFLTGHWARGCCRRRSAKRKRRKPCVCNRRASRRC